MLKSILGKIGEYPVLIGRRYWCRNRYWEKSASILCLLEEKICVEIDTGKNRRTSCAYWKVRFALKSILGKSASILCLLAGKIGVEINTGENRRASYAYWKIRLVLKAVLGKIGEHPVLIGR